MPGKDQSTKNKVIPTREINPEVDPSDINDIPVKPEEILDNIPDEDLFETPPYEEPEPGEGP